MMLDHLATTPVEIRRMEAGDEERVRLADHLFDDPTDPVAVRDYLRDPTNYLLLAYVGGAPAGFIRGQELLRLDTPRPMMFLYEVGVAEKYRGRGIGTALVQELARLSEARGCSEMFVLTNEANASAMGMYGSAGGQRNEERNIAMFEWSWETKCQMPPAALPEVVG
jgi:ribosomal protein S18 acetylase RimI-like enzyme